MKVTRLAALLGCLVLAGCAAGPAGSTTAGSTTAGSTTATATTATATTATARTAAATSTPSPTGSPTAVPSCLRHPLPTRNGPRLVTTDMITGAWICRKSQVSVATPAQARALATALALPTPPRPSHPVCADHVLADPPVWYLTTADGSVVSPAAPLDGCFRPIQAVQLAIAAITSPAS